MGKRLDKSMGKNDRAEPESNPPFTGESAGADSEKSQADTNNLPVVWSPNLDTGPTAEASPAEAANGTAKSDTAETITPDAGARGETPSGADADPIAAATPPRSSRFVLLAATIALVAAGGSFLGTMAASEVGRLMQAAPAVPSTANARDVPQAMKSQLAELSASFKSNLDGATRGTSAQFAKIAERLDRVERAAADPATKLAQIADTLDRLEKRGTAAPDTTGSITPGGPSASDAKLSDRVLDGWIVEDVREGRALVESRYGGTFIVGSGSVLPGLGRVDAVKRQDGQWVVVTARGVITSGR